MPELDQVSGVVDFGGTPRSGGIEKPTDMKIARVMYSISKAMAAKSDTEPYSGSHFEKMLSWCWT
jgi:hypothetical protein